MKKSLFLFLFLLVSLIQAQPSDEKINTLIEQAVFTIID